MKRRISDIFEGPDSQPKANFTPGEFREYVAGAIIDSLNLRVMVNREPNRTGNTIKVSIDDHFLVEQEKARARISSVYLDNAISYDTAIEYAREIAKRLLKDISL